MPNIKSAKKDVKKSRELRLRNRAAKSRLKTVIKKTYATAQSGKAEESQTSLRQAVKLLDSTASKGIIHKNQAARRKSRLMKRLNKLAAPPA